MFADTFFNSNFYKDIKSDPLFWIMRRFWMEDFIHTNGAKILGVKKVADSLDIKDSLAYHNDDTLIAYQDQVQLPEKFRFSIVDIVNMIDNFQSMIKNFKRPVYSIGHDVINHKTFYYMYNGKNYGWVDAKDFIHLNNLDTECLYLLKPFVEGYEDYFSTQIGGNHLEEKGDYLFIPNKDAKPSGVNIEALKQAIQGSMGDK